MDRIGALKGLVHFPKPVTEAQRILVFAEDDAAEQAKALGADIVGGKELIKQVEEGTLEFDHCLSTLDFLPNIKHLPKILRNKMPNTRRGTATDNIAEALKLFAHGESYLADNMGRIRQTVGLWFLLLVCNEHKEVLCTSHKTSFSNSDIMKNVKELIKAVDSHRTLNKEKFFLRVGLLIPPGPKLDLQLSEII